ncbi:MAG TPA: hypothetical protein VN026_05870 [Bacteroidia bacterium]|jgi:hypothetical protein|nr:hypothetical protein [Bacteroidia bacterium]
MEKISVNEQLFKFKYLPQFAEYILKNKLEEFVTVGIRLARELELPMMKPLAKFPENELIKLSIESTKRILKALSENNITPLIEENLNNWVTNNIQYLDKFDVAAEDLTLAYHIRRKVFYYFLYGYTQSAPIQLSIVNEVDVYSSMEELISLRVYFNLQKEKAETK